MRVLTLIGFISFFCFANAFAQPEQGYFLKLGGSYWYSRMDLPDLLQNSEPNTANGLFGMKTSNYQLSLSVGKKIKRRLFFWIDVSFRNERKVINSSKFVPEVTCSGHCSFITSYYYSKSNTWSIKPMAGFQYSLPVSQKVSFLMDAYAGYEWGDQSIFYERRQRKSESSNPGGFGTIHEVGTPYGEVLGGKINYPREYSSIHSGLRPSFRFTVTEKIAIDLGIGHFSYSKKIRDSRIYDLGGKSSYIGATFKPKNWVIGACYLF